MPGSRSTLSVLLERSVRVPIAAKPYRPAFICAPVVAADAAPTRGPKTIQDPRPSAAIRAAYQAKIDKLVQRMNASVRYWIEQAYASNEPLMAMDVTAGKFEWVKYKGETIEVTNNDRLGFSVRVGTRALNAVNGARSKFKSRDAAITAGRNAIDASISEADAKLAGQKARSRILKKGLPADQLRKVVRKMTRQWQQQFNEGAVDIAKHFAKSVAKRNDKVLAEALAKAGWTVEFKMTPHERDVIKATVNANVRLIKSIPQKYLNEVEGLVMRSVQEGRDLGTLSKQLQKQFGVTRRRAAFIARDQNNKATSALTRARQSELQIDEAVWRHSHAGKHPRPSHVRADGKRYKVAVGMYLDGVWTWPGVEPNCRCGSQSVLPGFM